MDSGEGRSSSPAEHPPGTYQARVVGRDSLGTGHIFYVDAFVTVVDSRT